MKIKTRDLIWCGIFSALIAVGAFIKIPFPIMPITFQTMFVTFAGFILGRRLGAISVLVYVLIGLLGIPVFVNGGGIGYVLQPTFGYLLGFILSAYLIGYIFEKSKNKALLTYILAGFVGIFAVYLLGLIYYFFITKFYLNSFIGILAMLWYCFLATLPGDILMMFIAVIFARKINLHLEKIK